MKYSTIAEIVVRSVSQREVIRAAQVWIEEAYRTQQIVGESLRPKNIVLRLDVRFDWSSVEQLIVEASDELLELVRERFKTPEIYILYSSGFELRLIHVSDNNSEKSDSEILNSIRSQELRVIAESSNALYHQFGNHYYRLPSGEICDFFFRVGNLLAEKSCLDKFWFWTIPYLKNVSHIVCDTWSISTLSAYIASSAQRYAGGNQISWSYLKSCMVDDVSMQKQLRAELEFESSKRKNILFILSATASGRTQATIQRVVVEKKIVPEAVSILTFFALTEEVVTKSTLCEISENLLALGLKGVVDETSLVSGERIYQVDHDTYFPMYFDTITHPFKPGRGNNTHTDASSKFFERYSGYNIFSVCRDGISNRALLTPRHHAFHVDAEKLFRRSIFKEQLNSSLSDTDRPYSHVVHLKEDADRVLIELVADYVDTDCEFIEIDDYSEIDGNLELLNAYSKSDATILFVDSMTISGGSRLERFQIALRRLCNSREFNQKMNNLKATYLIGLARPSTLAKFERLVRYFPQSSRGAQDWLRISIVEQVLLPDWHSEKCPWCAEKKVLESVVSKHEDQMSPHQLHYVEQRIDLLGSRQGLTKMLFFHRYPDDEFDFEFGSLFLNINNTCESSGVVTDADLVCAAASALQAWRNDTYRLPPATYVLPSSVTFDATMYNETRLKAAIWRSLLPIEVSVLDHGDAEVARTYLEYVYNSSDISKDSERKNEFVLGFEAAFLLGRTLKRILGKDNFEKIDWPFLKWVANEVRSAGQNN